MRRNGGCPSCCFARQAQLSVEPWQGDKRDPRQISNLVGQRQPQHEQQDCCGRSQPTLVELRKAQGKRAKKNPTWPVR
ncbi:hypothetical protein, partial [Salmonella enterica]|uniref:hypothetical protein n=1 Tax=Salmonella enterica TaxID=28901 RepID=UPI003CE74F26